MGPTPGQGLSSPDPLTRMRAEQKKREIEEDDGGAASPQDHSNIKMKPITTEEIRPTFDKDDYNLNARGNIRQLDQAKPQNIRSDAE